VIRAGFQLDEESQQRGFPLTGKFDLMSWQLGFMVLENRSLNIYPGRST
jgi:hypothetical protein